MWHKFRITILLLLLATVAIQAWHDQEALKWRQSLKVAIYPINADRSASVSAYLQTLTVAEFNAMIDYFTSQAEHYDLAISQPVMLYLGDEITTIPPAPPSTNSALNAIVWSLRFRLYAWLNSPELGVKPDIRMYLLYHDPNQFSALSHSSALSKGRIGRVNLFGDIDYNQQNMVILAHELLHTLSATDKYNLMTNQPDYPQGYVEPYKTPLYPQRTAELMAGRIPRTAARADIPKNLSETSIGQITAREIGWIQ